MHPSISRRMFLGASAAAGVLGSTALAPRAIAESLAPKKIGVQLYTVRNVIGKKEEQTLRDIAAIGYREIEGAGSDQFIHMAAEAKAAGLSQPSCHISTDAVIGSNYKGVPLEKIFGDLREIGTEYAVVPYVAENLRKREVIDQFGDKLNRAAELASKAGLQLAYHNHAFEWAEMDGKRIFDRMFGNTDPKLVKLEVDVFWLSVAGVDPVSFLIDHADRVALLHLKDKAASQKLQFNENVPKDTFKELGNGNVDIPGVLKAAKKIGVRHYFVEQDWTPADPIASLKQSFNYLSGLRA